MDDNSDDIVYKFKNALAEECVEFKNCPIMCRHMVQCQQWCQTKCTNNMIVL